MRPMVTPPARSVLRAARQKRLATTEDAMALADLAASQTNDEMQAILLSHRKSGAPGGLGDSRAIRAAIPAVLIQPA
jgi:hypothetical protein